MAIPLMSHELRVCVSHFNMYRLWTQYYGFIITIRLAKDDKVNSIKQNEIQFN